MPALGTVKIGISEATLLPKGAKELSTSSSWAERTTRLDLDGDGRADVVRIESLDKSGKPWLTEFRQATGALDGFNIAIKRGRVADIAVYIGGKAETLSYNSRQRLGHSVSSTDTNRTEHAHVALDRNRDGRADVVTTIVNPRDGVATQTWSADTNFDGKADQRGTDAMPDQFFK